MKIFRSINNNIVSAIDDNGREVVVIGKGIGWKAQPGVLIPQEKIDKIFIMRNQTNIDRLISLFDSIPAKYIELTDEILSFAKKHLNKRINESAYFTLADHINFSVLRMEQGMDFRNALYAEVRRFYSEEFEIGLYALRLIKEKLNVEMPEDEAASIAMHIINAEYDISIGDAFHATQLLDRLTSIVAREIGCVVDIKNYYGERFINHLRLLTQRIVRKEYLPDRSDGLYELLDQCYPKEISCCEKIADEIAETYQYNLSKEEICSLTIHLKRITARQFDD